jgi:ADP-ribose pyrophosphatase YjhB (NUDIX family)
VLLVKRTNPPGVGSWSIPAGFLEVDEPPKKAAVRELTEETGLEVALSDIELFETNLVAHPDNKYVLVIIYVAARDATTGSVRAGSDAADAKFWNIDDLSTANESIELGYEPILREAIGED